MWVKILASLALIGIILSIIGTALLVITSGGSHTQAPELTQEQLQEIIDAQNISVEAATASWETLTTETTSSWVTQ